LNTTSIVIADVHEIIQCQYISFPHSFALNTNPNHNGST
jgi:hypothetical protein